MKDQPDIPYSLKLHAAPTEVTFFFPLSDELQVRYFNIGTLISYTLHKSLSFFPNNLKTKVQTEIIWS